MNKRGVGIIELVAVVAIILIVSSLILVSSINFRKGQALNNSVDTIKTAIQEAQERTLASEDASQFGVHFDSDRVIVFKGTTYSSSDPNNVNYLIPDETEISATSLAGGGSSMVFEKITGKTGQYGTITVRLKVDTTMTKILTVSSSFTISIQ